MSHARSAEIAAELFVPLSTVRTHLANVRTTREARNRVEIAARRGKAGRPGQEPAPAPPAGCGSRTTAGVRG
ncbi:hypothetical protein [Streptomyces sp. NRRL S-118]|uniref:hypothetical protein n=1 Tax=Streptomyces sp. NRRL S-118 TaxID=1463881 RepID=UPI0004C714F9